MSGTAPRVMSVNSQQPDAPTSPASADDARWRDDPIREVREDRLGRSKFAENCARLICDAHSAKSSVVYGLEGPWGSGKSSVISMIDTFLTGPKDSHWRVVQFTPWATAGTESLLQEFFSALSSALPEGEGARSVRRRLLNYADVARPLLAAVPVAGPGLAEASRTLEDRLRKPWNVAFQEVADALVEIGAPILVVVDDIDRLQPGELLDLLKVVRLLGRFPGVDFLLAYDERTIVETLLDPRRGTVTASRARAFMEKIVQYPLTMPPLLTAKITKMLDEGLTEIVTAERIESSFEKGRFSEIIRETMPSQLTTPRAIGRFLAQVTEQFRIHDVNEMNDVDLILTTFVRVQFPDLFAQLQRWRPQLTNSLRGAAAFYTQDKDTDWSELFDAVEGDRNKRDARTVLKALFPAVEAKQHSRAAARRFAHPDYFDRYLAQTIPEGDIPDSVITRALEEAAAGRPAELRGLLLHEDDERVTLAMSKVRERYPDPSEMWRVDPYSAPITPELMTAVAELIVELPDRVDSWSSDLSSTVYWMASLVRTTLSKDPDADVAASLDTCSDLHRRAYVVSSAQSDTYPLNEPAQAALGRLHRHEAEIIVPELLKDLRAGDTSTGLAGGVFLYNFVIDAGLESEIQKAVRGGLAAEEFTVADVAARFVGFSFVVGGSGKPSGASFTGQLFTTVTGIPAKSVDLRERDEWTDTSWARKREFAMEFVNPVPDDDEDRADAADLVSPAAPPPGTSN